LRDVDQRLEGAPGFKVIAGVKIPPPLNYDFEPQKL
jgi:hypothetical protein